MDIFVIDDIPLDDELEALCMCQQNKAYVEDAEISRYIDAMILPHVQKHPDAVEGIYAQASHVHISDAGLEPHTHEPYSLVAVLYFFDSLGELVITDGSHPNIQPRRGRLVLMRGTTSHYVIPSTERELRMSLVTNFHHEQVQPFPETFEVTGKIAYRS